MNVLTVENISKTFTIPHQKRTSTVEFLANPFKKFEIDRLKVFDNISFSVQQGETLGIIGTNGAGKSTLLKLLASIYLPDDGTISVVGKIVPFLELGVGFNPELTGRENVYLNGIILGMKRAFLKEKLNDIIQFAELDRFIDLPLKNYSSGMQVRLAFSIAFMAEADIYLLDEVFSVGDIAFQEKCKTVFRKLKAQGKTLILVSHSLTTIAENCNRILVVSKGTVELFDNVQEGIERYKVLSTQN